MNILIVGKSGVGKSNLGDIIRNTIFKLDSDALIKTDDPDRSVKTFGTGSNEYGISIERADEWESLRSAVTEEVTSKEDIIIVINNENFQKWFREVFNK